MFLDFAPWIISLRDINKGIMEFGEIAQLLKYEDDLSSINRVLNETVLMCACKSNTREVERPL